LPLWKTYETRNQRPERVTDIEKTVTGGGMSPGSQNATGRCGVVEVIRDLCRVVDT